MKKSRVFSIDCFHGRRSDNGISNNLKSNKYKIQMQNAYSRTNKMQA